MEQLQWLPEIVDWRAQLRALNTAYGDAWSKAVTLANSRLDFVRTNALDEVVRRRYVDESPDSIGTKPVKLAILGSSTLSHLYPSIRIGGLRRNICIKVYENDYGQYLQELLDRSSALHSFKPNTVLFAFDSRHLTQGINASLSAVDVDDSIQEVSAKIRQCWRFARDAFGCSIIQQTVLDVWPAVLGSNEHRLPGSRSRVVGCINAALRRTADEEKVGILSLDTAVLRHGLDAWHDAALWHRSKQEVTPAAAPTYGDLVGRLIAAQQGRSYKALVLDLDNTLWGGVIGDDGLDGIVLGQGSPLGEGFIAVQEYVRELARRGVILAVSSKNDEVNALEPFDKHPEMVLRRRDIATFRVDWNDKVANIRAIAEDLNIALDALVFLDDNPFERDLVRDALPMVAVPETPDDPALVPGMLGDAGYFESLAVTEEDLERTKLYQQNRERDRLKATRTDIKSYLRDLDMKMIWSRFNTVGLQRITQLINKTNQFNLTTRRYSEEEIISIIGNPAAVGLQIRLIDRFGDNGIIAIIIGRWRNDDSLYIDTWLMSCRVLGRQVEQATLNLVAEHARSHGARYLVGEYIPTKKNGMVQEHYPRLGFAVVSKNPDDSTVFRLDLNSFAPADADIVVAEGRE